MRSTRDLWDPKYEQESWIKNTGNYTPVALIPRLKKWIADHNPGMELCLGEYNFGGGDNVTGGLAQAEVFGVLAREGVDLAFIWYQPEGTQELAWKLFRSYDGKRRSIRRRKAGLRAATIRISRSSRRSGRRTGRHGGRRQQEPEQPVRAETGLRHAQGQAARWRFDQDTGDMVVEVAEQGDAVDGTVKLTLPAASASMMVVAPDKSK